MEEQIGHKPDGSVTTYEWTRDGLPAGSPLSRWTLDGEFETAFLALYLTCRRIQTLLVQMQNLECRIFVTNVIITTILVVETGEGRTTPHTKYELAVSSYGIDRGGAAGGVKTTGIPATREQ